MSNSFEGVIIFIISLLSAFFSSIILLSFLLFKSRLTKQDAYIIQKFLIQFAFFASYLCISVYNSSLEEEQIKTPSMKNQVLCGYLIFIYFINFFINYEHYKSFKDPTYVLRILIKKSKGYLLIDFVILIIIGGYFTLDIFYLHLMNKANEPFELIHNYPLFIIIGVISISSLVFFPLNKLNYPDYKLRSNKNFNICNWVYFIINLLYFAFSAFLIISYFLKQNSTIDITAIKYSIYSIGLLDDFLNMGTIYHSGFYFYNLGLSNMGSCFCCFGCNRNFYSPILFNDGSTYRTADFDNFMANLYNTIGYVIDDYVVDAFDYMLNMTMVSLSKVYENLRDGIFVYKKDETQNDFDNERIKEYNTTNTTFNFSKVEKVEVNIQCLYAEKLKETMNVYHIRKEDIVRSLLSNKGQSLLSKNTKDEYFKSLQNLCIKTYDKQLLLEIYSDINLDDKKIKKLLSMYITHLNSSKMNTFLPILLGVFKVKINSFREIVIFVSKNPLIEDRPENYNYWQLMRFDYNQKLSKLASSKDRDSFIITTDRIFSHNNKFAIEGFDIVSQTLESDFKLLKKINSEQFSLLILYYELELNNKKSKDTIDGVLFPNTSLTDPIIEIPESSKPSTETFVSTMNDKASSVDRDRFDTLRSKRNENIVTESLSEQFLGNQDDNINIDKDQPSMITYMNQSSSGIIKNGFDSLYNNYKGTIYFSFENLFESGGCFRSNAFYKNYLKEIMKIFAEKKK